MAFTVGFLITWIWCFGSGGRWRSHFNFFPHLNSKLSQPVCSILSPFPTVLYTQAYFVRLSILFKYSVFKKIPVPTSYYNFVLISDRVSCPALFSLRNLDYTWLFTFHVNLRTTLPGSIENLERVTDLHVYRQDLFGLTIT